MAIEFVQSLHVHGGVSGSALARGAPSMQVLLETWVRIPCEAGVPV